jgi:hypothetical protein
LWKLASAANTTGSIGTDLAIELAKYKARKYK